MLFGDYHLLSSVEAEYQKITAADIQRVMKKYLVPTNRTVAILVPTEPSHDSGESK